jgi:hypothetical protein
LNTNGLPPVSKRRFSGRKDMPEKGKNYANVPEYHGNDVFTRETEDSGS